MKKFIQSVVIIWYREILRQWRERTPVIAGLSMPLLFLFVFGEGISSSLGVYAGFDYLEFMFPGVIAMTVMMTAMFSAISLVFDREFGFLKEMLVAPIPRSSIILGKILGASTVGILQGLLMLALSPIIGIELDALLVLKVIAILFILAFSITSLGVAIASRIQSIQSFQYVMPVFMMPLLFLSGAFFPLSNPPAWLAFLSTIDPLTYGVDLFRGIFLEGTMPPEMFSQLILHSWQLDLLAIAGFSVATFVLAVLLFRDS